MLHEWSNVSACTCSDEVRYAGKVEARQQRFPLLQHIMQTVTALACAGTLQEGRCEVGRTLWWYEHDEMLPDSGWVRRAGCVDIHLDRPGLRAHESPQLLQDGRTLDALDNGGSIVCSASPYSRALAGQDLRLQHQAFTQGWQHLLSALSGPKPCAGSSYSACVGMSPADACWLVVRHRGSVPLAHRTKALALSRRRCPQTLGRHVVLWG